MPVKFNPFTGQLQIDEKGASASYIDGEVATYNDLPLDGTAALNSAWLVREASGIWPVSRKQAGIYIRTATAGSSRDADYTYAGTMPDVFSDAVLTIYDEASTTRTGQFNLGSITAGQNRVLTWPDGNGTIALTTTVVDNATGLWDSVNNGQLLSAGDGELIFNKVNYPNVYALITPNSLTAVRFLTLPDASGTIARTEDFASPPAIGSTTRNTGAFTTLNATNGTITASAPVLDLSQTWNNAAVTFTGLRFNVTNTASAAASNIADFQVGGTSIVTITRDGVIGNANAGINVRETGSFNRLSFRSQGQTRLLHNNSILLNESDGGYGWVTSGAPTSLGFDTGIFRGGAGIIEQRNLTNAQTYRIYNTFTDASNHERLFLRWNANVAQIGTEKLGTGSARALEFQTDGITRFTLAAANTATFAGGLALQWGGGGTRIIGATFPSNLLQLQTASTDRLVINDTLVAFGSATNAFPALKRSSTALQVRLADDSAFAPLESSGLTLTNTNTFTLNANDSFSATAYVSLDGVRLLFKTGNTARAGISAGGDFFVLNNLSVGGLVGAGGFLTADGANILAERNGVNPQTLRIYNTWSSATSFERLNIRWATNECIIDAEAGSGGGTLRGIKIGSATSSLLGFYGATPVTQRAAIADATDAATTQARLNDLLATMRSLGLIAT